MAYYTYMLASGRNGTLYIGVTNDLVRRVWEHKQHATPGFSDRYDVTSLVWFEVHTTAEAAITREKALKRYKRQWKLQLIEAGNPDWRDLYEDVSR
ncbi:MAG: GIY-YIG nuclease family protein [Alphaproteobacteria bacterium]|nr:MAG: GIY-YIG nuclease family protein [Alphaproteobacteria bacterium]